MKVMIPNQHGAWAMLLIPFLLGMVKGGPVLWHIPLFLGWLFLYLAVYPITLALKRKQLKPYQKWIYAYGFPACCFLMISVFHKPPLIWIGVTLVPLFLIHMYFARRKNERALMNDIAGVLFFCSGGLASCWLGTGTLDGWAWFIFSKSALFFIGSSFYVKSGRKKTEHLRTGHGDIICCSPFYRVFSEQAGHFSLLSPAVCGRGFFTGEIGPRKRSAFWKSQMPASFSPSCVYVSQIEKQGHRLSLFFQSILQISSGQFSHSISHRK